MNTPYSFFFNKFADLQEVVLFSYKSAIESKLMLFVFLENTLNPYIFINI